MKLTFICVILPPIHHFCWYRLFIAIIISTLIGIPMVLCYSIADGICLGILSYVLIKMMVGKFKDLNPTLYILSIFLLFNYVFS